jgi:hypothetical protein
VTDQSLSKSLENFADLSDWLKMDGELDDDPDSWEDL